MAKTNAVDLLEHQHKQIRRAFRRALLPGPGRPTRFGRLMKLLAVHEAAEEAHVHPLVRKQAADGTSVIAARLTEEKQAKKLLTAVKRTGPAGRGFTRQLLALRGAVVAHAKREEREEFPLLRRQVAKPRLQALAAEIKLTQAVAPTRPHRWVNSQLANKLMAPLLGPVDRGLDAARTLARR